MKTTTGNIKDLTPDNRNANKHKERGKELLQKSLHELGAGRSVLADVNGVLIAGNNTVETAIAEGITKTIVVETTGNELVVVKRTDLDLNDAGESGRRARQMALIDNAAALEGIEWDVEAVQEIEEQWGFDAGEWGVELPEEEKEIPAAEEDEGAGALPSHPVTVKGDVWELISEGKKLRHRVMCGDSTDSDAVGLLMGGQKADMVFTDPPYGVNYEGGHNKKKRDGIENDKLAGQDLTDLFYEALMNAHVFSKAYCAFYIWYANGKAVETFASFSKLPLSVRAVICWYKIDSGLGAFMAQYIPNYEPCIYAFKTGESPQWFGASNEKTVWELKKEAKNDFHPTQKPVELPARAITNSSKLSDIVYDCFLGSGSTLIACEQLKRNCYGMELDEKYCDVIVRRWIAQMEKDGAKWKVLLNGEERADMVSKLLGQNN